MPETGANAPSLARAWTGCGSVNVPLTSLPGLLALGSAMLSAASAAEW